MSNDRKTTTRTGRRTGRTNYLPWLKLLIRLLIIGVTALVVILLVNNWRKIAPLSFIDWYDQVSGTVEKGQEYPYTLDGNAVIDMAEVSPHLVVLGESSIRFFTEDAACVVERSHPFADPTLHTAGPYALLTEVGGSRIQLETRRETVLRTEIKNRKIYAGDLAADGTMAFVLNSSSQSYLSEIRVLNAKGESLFEYQSSKYLLNDIALSPDRKKVAVTGTTAEDGLLKSVVLVIDLQDKQVSEYAGSQVLLHTVSYLSDNVILAVGDREVWTLTGKDGSLSKISCDGLVPIGYTATSSMACVVLKRDGATDAGTAWLFDSTSALVKQVEYTGILRSVSGRDEEVTLLTDTVLYELTLTGVRRQNAIPSDSLLAAFYGDEPMVLTFSELKRLEK